jgi:hypothetical protein
MARGLIAGAAAKALTLVLCHAALAWARPEGPPPGHTRALAVPKASTPPTIDGALDDELWQSAAVADQFWVSEQERWPGEPTEALVAADAEYLYVAFRCYDSEPDAIDALQTRRDAGMGRDDHVIVQLDPYHNHRAFFTFYVNARGTQDDYTSVGRARRMNKADDWKAAAVRTSYGWSAELAIPFRILSYRNGGHVFGVNFVRYRHRSDEWSRWANWTPQTKPEEMGHLTDLELPAQRNSSPWTFAPFALVGRNGPARDGAIHQILWTGGVDLRYTPRPDVTGAFALNPDFSQVEKQITDIDFNYNEKARGDPRAFFQEGSVYYGRSSTYFYSNRIPDFDYGSKFFAQIDKWQLGALATSAPDARRDAVLRVGREINDTHSAAVSLVATDRQDLGNEVAAFQFDGRRRSGVNYRLDSALSRSQKHSGGDGELVRAAIGWSGNRWSVGTNVDRHDVDFSPANGLIRRDLLGTWGLSGSLGYYRDIASGPLRTVTFGMDATRRDTTDGLPQTRSAWGSASVELRSQIRVGIAYSDSDYRPAAGPRGWADGTNDDRYWTARVDFNTRGSRFGYGVAYSDGDLGSGGYRYAQAYAWFRPAATVYVHIYPELLHSFGRFDQTIVTAGWDITPANSVLGRVISADGRPYLRLAYRRQLRAGLNLFAVSDREPDQPNRLSIKCAVSFP